MLNGLPPDSQPDEAASPAHADLPHIGPGSLLDPVVPHNTAAMAQHAAQEAQPLPQLQLQPQPHPQAEVQPQLQTPAQPVLGPGHQQQQQEQQPHALARAMPAAAGAPAADPQSQAWLQLGMAWAELQHPRLYSALRAAADTLPVCDVLQYLCELPGAPQALVKAVASRETNVTVLPGHTPEEHGDHTAATEHMIDEPQGRDRDPRLRVRQRTAGSPAPAPAGAATAAALLMPQLVNQVREFGSKAHEDTCAQRMSTVCAPLYVCMLPCD